MCMWIYLHEHRHECEVLCCLLHGGGTKATSGTRHQQPTAKINTVQYPESSSQRFHEETGRTTVRTYSYTTVRRTICPREAAHMYGKFGTHCAQNVGIEDQATLL